MSNFLFSYNWLDRKKELHDHTSVIYKNELSDTLDFEYDQSTERNLTDGRSLGVVSTHENIPKEH